MKALGFDLWRTSLAVLAASVVIAAAIGGCVAVALSLTDPSRHQRLRPRRVRHASRCFAELVARGELERADSLAGELLGSNRVEWDERAILDLSLSQARRELVEPAPSATWFPDVRRVSRGEVVELVLGRGEPIHLIMTSEVWTRDLDGMMFEASSGTCSITGSVSFRTILDRIDRPALRTAVEVVVHMEAADVPEARRVLARARMITHDGLERMAACLNAG